MIYVYSGVCLALALLAYCVRQRIVISRRAAAIERASAVGAAFDGDGNINARASYERMRAEEEQSGEKFTGKQAVFMELVRLVAEGPKTPEEIRYLLDAGFEAIVRPDGLVYVPCVENEHLQMDGEIALTEEDLKILEE